MSITHRPHLPRRGIAGIIHRRHRADGEPTIEIEPVTDESIHAWLSLPNTGPEDVQGVARMPFTVQPASPATPIDLPGSPRMLEAEHVTVYTELDDDERFAERLLAMEREAQADADVLAGENDTRMTLLLARAKAATDRWEKSKAAAIFARRRDLIRAMVPEVGHLLAWGDVTPATAVWIVSLRSRFLSAPQESAHLPKLTPELLAAMDAERGRVTIHAPGCEYDNCIGCVVMPDEEGGYEVQLPGVDHWLHFERSELEFAAAGAA